MHLTAYNPIFVIQSDKILITNFYNFVLFLLLFSIAIIFEDHIIILVNQCTLQIFILGNMPKL